MVFSTSFLNMLRQFRNDGCKIATAIHAGYATNEEMDYITCRGDMISFLPAGREHRVNDNGRWMREGRQEGKPTRVIRKIIRPAAIEQLDIKDSDFEKFGYAIRSYVMTNGDGDPDSQVATATIVVCNGAFIGHYYSHDNYAPDVGGNLAGSCMRNADEEYFDIYEGNPDVCHMAVAITPQHKVLGRALLWKTSQHGWCMDTIYAEEHIRPMFINFAVSNNMRYKSDQSCHTHVFNMYNREHVMCGDVDVQLRYCDYDLYPYLDTLYYLDTNICKLQNYQGNADRELRNTDGDFSNMEDEVECIHSGNYCNENDCRYVDYRYNGSYYEGYVYEDYVVYVRGGYHVIIDHAVEVGCHGDWYLRDDDNIRHSEYDDTYYHIDDCVYVESESDYRHVDDCVEIDYEWYLKEDCVKDHNGKWIHSDDAIEIDGITYHKDDYEEQPTDEPLNENV
jgi:hypothetical protein